MTHRAEQSARRRTASWSHGVMVARRHARARWAAGIPTASAVRPFPPWLLRAPRADRRRWASERALRGYRLGRRAARVGGHVANFTAHDPPSRETQQGRGHSATPRDAQCAPQHAAMDRGGSREPRDPPARSRARCDLGAKRFVAYHDAAPARPSGRTLVRRRNSRARSC